MASGGGDAINSQRARPRVVAGLVGMHGLALALLTGVPALAAALDSAWWLALCLAVAALPPLAGFIVQRRLGPIEAPHRIEGLVAVAAAFLLGALLATPAFVSLGMSPVSAFFEAVSGVTTTGLSVAGDTTDWPVSAHFLRAWLQWAGGFAFAAMAIALVVGRGVVALRLGLAETPGETLLGSAGMRARSVLTAYLAATALACAVAAIVAVRPVEGVLIALASISTGGFAPASDSLGGVGLGLQVAAVAAMLAGAVSMTLYASAWRDGVRTLLADGELRVLLGIAAGATLIAIAVEALRPDGAGAWDSALMALSAQTTAGFSTVDPAGLAPATLVLLVVVMAIGGSLGSTAGGLKVFRVAFAFAAARAALVRTSLSPNTVTRLRVFGRPADTDEQTAVFALFVLMLAGVTLLWMGLLLGGQAPLPALFDTVSAFSTVGLSAGAIGPDLPAGLQLAAAGAMLLGRLEFLAFLALLRPRTWLG